MPGAPLRQLQSNVAGAARWTPVQAPVKSPLLDVVTSPLCAFGTRRLSSAYTGALLNALNETTSTAADVGYLPDNSLDTGKLDSTCGSAICKIATLYDQSGAAANATQTTDANRPLSTGVLEGGQRTVTFDWDTNLANPVWMSLPAACTPTSSQAVTLLMVMRVHALTMPSAVIDLGVAPNDVSYDVNNADYFTAGASPSTLNVGDDSYDVVAVTASTSGVSIAQNNDRPAATGVAAVSPSGTGYIGRTTTTALANFASTYGRMNLSALVVYNRTLTAAELANARAILISAFNVQPQYDTNLVVGVDSQTYGVASVLLESWWKQVQRYLGEDFRVRNFGVPSQTLYQACSNASYPNTYGKITTIDPAKTNIAILYPDSNDVVVGGQTGAQMYGYFAGTPGTNSYTSLSCTTKLRASGYSKIIWGLPGARSASAAQLTNIAAFVSLAKANASLADGTADFSTDATIGAGASISNTACFYTDQIHWLDQCHGYAAQILAPVLARALPVSPAN